MSHEHVLLVEGINDLHAVRNLLYCHEIVVYHEDDNDEDSPVLESSAFEIKHAGIGDGSGGESKFSKAIATHFKADDIQTLGVIADADCECSDQWRSLLNELFSFEQERTVTAIEDYDRGDGWIGETVNQIRDPVRVGVWIMPDNESTGAFEEFAKHLVPDDDELWEYSEDVIDELPERRFDDKDKGKAHIHTWLAWQETPREPIGRAIKQGVLTPEADLAEDFVEWVRRLFPSLDAET